MSDPSCDQPDAQTWRIRPVSASPEELTTASCSHEADTNAPARVLPRYESIAPLLSNDSASRLVAEFYQRRERGEASRDNKTPDDWTHWGRAAVEINLHENRVASVDVPDQSLAPPLRLPEVGDELFGFTLRLSLGNGAFARVFVAEQANLACRPVVLKISAIEGTEPQTLARLQHTNIVPIHSVHEDPARGVRAVCMPYLGGANLCSVLERLWKDHSTPHLGSHLVRSLEAESTVPPELWNDATSVRRAPSTAELQTPLSLMKSMNYIQAVVWTVAQLAEGLHHAHQRGILHRDIKPSNILLSAEGQPLLLDFNVAQESQGHESHTLLGGTVAYAAPEHLKALLERTPEFIEKVDRRSDLYSLGLVLAEMLTSQRIFEQVGSYSALPTQLEAMVEERSRCFPSPRSLRPDIPWSLESITRKCLNPSPAHRYQTAEELAEDLRRFLDDRPLKYAPELSRFEQCRKFRRRHPRLTTGGPVLASLLVMLLIIGSAWFGAREHLASLAARERMRAHDTGTIRALCLVNTTLGRKDHLSEGIETCEKTLALYNQPHQRPLDQHPDWARLTTDQKTHLAEDRRELLLLLADARTRLANDHPAALREALDTLDAAEAIPGLEPSKALWLDRANYWTRLHQPDRAAAAREHADRINPKTGRDFYLLAISQARQGGIDGLRRAVDSLNTALQLNPRNYWATLQRGICRMELGETAQAIGDFGTCIGLWPEHPWGYFNRGYLFDRLGTKAQAIDDYSSALALDSNFIEARVNRGLALLERKEYNKALEDFDKGIATDPGDYSPRAGRAVALEALGRFAEADANFQQAFDRVGSNQSAQIRLLWTYGFAVCNRRPAEALAAFDRVLSHDAQHPQALYGRAMLAMSSGQLDTALTFFDRALATDPGFIEARRFRAIVLARKHEWDRASQDINTCLGREPRSGETLYAAACVAAKAAEALPSQQAFDQAIDLLRRAIALGAGKHAESDPDLVGIRADPRFRQLLHPSSETATMSSFVDR